MAIPKYLVKGKSEHFILQTLKEFGAQTIRSVMDRVDINYGTIQQICSKLQKEKKIFVSGFEGNGFRRQKIFSLGVGVDAIYTGNGEPMEYTKQGEIEYTPIGSSWIPQRTEAELREVQTNYFAFLNRRFA